MNFFRKLGFGDRRAGTRISISPPLKCLFSCPQLGQEGFLACLTDISKSGALISIRKSGFNVGSDVEVRPQVQSGKQPIIVHGKIVKIYRQGATERCSLAIKFYNKDERDIRLLLEYIVKRA